MLTCCFNANENEILFSTNWDRNEKKRGISHRGLLSMFLFLAVLCRGPAVVVDHDKSCADCRLHVVVLVPSPSDSHFTGCRMQTRSWRLTKSVSVLQHRLAVPRERTSHGDTSGRPLVHHGENHRNLRQRGGKNCQFTVHLWASEKMRESSNFNPLETSLFLFLPFEEKTKVSYGLCINGKAKPGQPSRIIMSRTQRLTRK